LLAPLRARVGRPFADGLEGPVAGLSRQARATD